MRRTRWAAAAAVFVTTTLTGCALTPDGEAVATEAVEERAHSIAQRLDHARNLTSATDIAGSMFASTTYSAPASSTSTSDSPTARVELLKVSGSTREEGGAVLEVRINGHAPARSGDGFSAPSYAEGSAVRCYRYTVRTWGLDERRPHRITCSDDPPLPTPPPPFVPSLNDDADALLKKALGRYDDSEAIRAYLAPKVGRGIAVDVWVQDGTIGVALFAELPGNDCLLGKRTAAGDASVYYPPSITVAPGESSCSGATAAGPELRPPH